MLTRSRRRVGLGAVTGLWLSVLSCGRNPTSPSPGQLAPPNAIVRLELVAPQEIAPGESAQLTARAVRSDGAVDNVTSQAQWTVQSVPTSSVLTLTGSGLATGVENGRGLVTVRFASHTADATVLVLPKGTYRLTGRITANGVGLENATVTVIAGVGSGLTARTNVAGDYELYGAAGLVQIRASKPGYLDTTQQLDVTAHGSLTLELPARPVDNYAGVYALSITARDCSPRFPDAAKRREYIARVEQTGAEVRVSLSAGDFLPRSDAFAGVVGPTGEIRFTIRPLSVWDYDGPDLQERLSDGTILVTLGTIRATSTPAGISGTAMDQEAGLGGVFHLPPRGASWSLSQATGSCYIDRFEMVPR